jgi:hypothetical protein
MSLLSREYPLALGIVLNIIGLGFFCWVLLTLAIYALPFFVGMTAGLYAHGAGAGPFGAIVLGLLAAAFTLVIGQTIFSLVRTPILRIAVALMSAVPAALAGYYATFGLSGLTITSVSLAVGLRRDRRGRDRGNGLGAACSIPARRIGRARKTGNVAGPATPRPDETSSTPSRTPWVLIGARPKLGLFRRDLTADAGPMDRLWRRGAPRAAGCSCDVGAFPCRLSSGMRDFAWNSKGRFQ